MKTRTYTITIMNTDKHERDVPFLLEKLNSIADTMTTKQRTKQALIANIESAEIKTEVAQRIVDSVLLPGIVETLKNKTFGEVGVDAFGRIDGITANDKIIKVNPKTYAIHHSEGRLMSDSITVRHAVVHSTVRQFINYMIDQGKIDELLDLVA